MRLAVNLMDTCLAIVSDAERDKEQLKAEESKGMELRLEIIEHFEGVCGRSV